MIVKLYTSRMLVSSTGWLQYYSIGHGETEVLSVALRDHGDGVIVIVMLASWETAATQFYFQCRIMSYDDIFHMIIIL